jgi:hypothetical protein
VKALFSALPHEVLTDKRLTPADKVTYAAMASEIRRQGVNIVSWQNTELADLAHLERRSIGKSIKRLSVCGHISTAIDKVNGRPTYWLKSDVFLPKTKLLSMPKRSHKK